MWLFQVLDYNVPGVGMKFYFYLLFAFNRYFLWLQALLLLIATVCWKRALWIVVSTKLNFSWYWIGSYSSSCIKMIFAYFLWGIKDSWQTTQNVWRLGQRSGLYLQRENMLRCLRISAKWHLLICSHDNLLVVFSLSFLSQASQ